MGRLKALLVAIDNYDDPRNDLNSCLNDSRAFRELLVSRYGFAADSIHSLLDVQATQTNVDRELRWLFEGAGPDDRLVFHYSGHGCQVPSERDKSVYDEALVLRGPYFYRDDRLAELSQGLAPGILTIICDSCYSGGMEKDCVTVTDDGVWHRSKSKMYRPAESEKELRSEAPRRVRTFGCSLQGSTRAVAHRFALASQAPLGKPFRPAPPTDEYDPQVEGLLLSACLETETASAQTPKTNGLSAFTFALLEGVNELGPGASNRALIEYAQTRLLGIGLRQTPLLKERDLSANIGAKSFILLGSTAPSVPVGARPDYTLNTDSLVALLLGKSPASTKALAEPQVDEKSLRAVIDSVWSVAPSMVPVVLAALRKEYTPTEQKGWFNVLMASVAPHTMLVKGPQEFAPDQKFFGVVLDVLMSTAPQLVPAVLSALTKDYPAETAGKGWVNVLAAAFAPHTMLVKGVAGEEADQKFFGAVLRTLGQIAPQVVPVVIEALAKEYAPDGGQKGWFNVLMASVAPHTMLVKEFKPDQPDEKFLSLAASALIAVLPRLVPVVVDAIKKENSAKAWSTSFTPPIWSPDALEIVRHTSNAPGPLIPWYTRQSPQANGGTDH